MRFLNRSCVFAYCGTMLITNPGTSFFRGEIPGPTEEDSRRGFLARDQDCIFLYVLNHTWRVPISVYLADSEPENFVEAQRVVRFPFAARSGEVLIGGILYGPEEWSRVQVAAGDYTLYWVGYNLDKRWPSEEQIEMEEGEYAELRDVERYDMVLVARACTSVGILKGNDYLYDKVSV